MRRGTVGRRAVLFVAVGIVISLGSFLMKCCSSQLALACTTSGFFSHNVRFTPTLRSLTLTNLEKADIFVHYINLRSRPDRMKLIIEQLSFLRVPYSRVEAFDFRNNGTALLNCWDNNDLPRCAGKLGCKESHMKTLELHQLHHQGESNEVVVVFEDDFIWLGHVDPSRIPEILKGFQHVLPDWKVIGLSMNIIHQQPTNMTVRLSRDTSESTRVMMIEEAQTTHGYAIRASYLPILLKTWRECDVTGSLHAAIDQCWKPLQAQGGWYAFSPQVGTQKPGYSDIENTEVAYNIS
jgi:GR25 family glycosyltransferase involved in LPS biosynthesis